MSHIGREDRDSASGDASQPKSRAKISGQLLLPFIAVAGLIAFFVFRGMHTTSEQPMAMSTQPVATAYQQPIDRPTPASNVRTPTADDLRVEKIAREGSVIYGRLIKRYKYTGLYVLGMPGSTPSLDVDLPPRAWESLSNHEKVALSYFVESQTAIVKEHPAVYSLFSEAAPIWPTLSATYASICPGCWEINVGRYDAKGTEIETDHAVAVGDELRQRRRVYERAMSASDLRRHEFKGVPVVLSWKVDDLDPVTRFHANGLQREIKDPVTGDDISQTPADLAGAWLPDKHAHHAK